MFQLHNSVLLFSLATYTTDSSAPSTPVTVPQPLVCPGAPSIKSSFRVEDLFSNNWQSSLRSSAQANSVYIIDDSERESVKQSYINDKAGYYKFVHFLMNNIGSHQESLIPNILKYAVYNYPGRSQHSMWILSSPQVFDLVLNANEDLGYTERNENFQRYMNNLPGLYDDLLLTPQFDNFTKRLLGKSTFPVNYDLIVFPICPHYLKKTENVEETFFSVIHHNAMMKAFASDLGTVFEQIFTEGSKVYANRKFFTILSERYIKENHLDNLDNITLRNDDDDINLELVNSNVAAGLRELKLFVKNRYFSVPKNGNLFLRFDNWIHSKELISYFNLVNPSQCTNLANYLEGDQQFHEKYQIICEDNSKYFLTASNPGIGLDRVFLHKSIMSVLLEINSEKSSMEVSLDVFKTKSFQSTNVPGNFRVVMRSSPMVIVTKENTVTSYPLVLILLFVKNMIEWHKTKVINIELSIGEIIGINELLNIKEFLAERIYEAWNKTEYELLPKKIPDNI